MGNKVKAISRNSLTATKNLEAPRFRLVVGLLLFVEMLPWFFLAATAVSAVELALMRRRFDAIM